MDQGYVKLWRKSVDSGLMQNHKLWVFWTWCLMKASHKKRKQMVGMQMVDLNPGDFIFGRKAASKELKLSEQTIRTCVQNLKKLQNLTIKVTNKFSIISVVNWGIYQVDENNINQHINHQVTSNQPTSNQQLTTNKNVSIKECEEEQPPLTPQGENLKPTKIELKNYLIRKIEVEDYQDLKDQIISFFEYRMLKPKKQQYQTEKGINGLFRELKKCRGVGMNIFDSLEIAMENNWQTIKPSYFENKNGDSGPGEKERRRIEIETYAKEHGL